MTEAHQDETYSAEPAQEIALASFQLGQSLAAENQWQAAIDVYLQALQYAPEMLEAIDALGALCFKTGQLTQAWDAWARVYQIEAFAERRQLEPKQQESALRQKLDAWLRGLRTAGPELSYHHFFTAFFFALGWFPDSYVPPHRLEQDNAFWQQALSSNPRSLHAHARLGQLCAYLGDLENAIVLFEQCLFLASNQERKRLWLKLALEYLREAQHTLTRSQPAETREALAESLVEGPTPQLEELLEAAVALAERPIAETYPGGEPLSRGRYHLGKREGLWTFYHSCGQPREQGAYTGGKRDGAWQWWDESGILSVSGFYKKGRKDGLWSQWDAGGSLCALAEYKAGRLMPGSCGESGTESPAR